jgi:uncharacterized protein (TIGR00730 family)
MPNPGALCVYCGSSGAVDPRYRAAASELGQEMARRGITLVYGGGRVGLMGLAADACMQAGGKVIGIIPDFLQRDEIGHAGITELIVVDSMHTRKQLMAEMADGFVILPGGYGTLEEFFEILTWKQLQLHDKPILIFDAGDYWAPLTDLLDHVLAENFARPESRALWARVASVADLFRALTAASTSHSPTLTDLT